MSIATIHVVRTRITSATPDSPMAVFIPANSRFLSNRLEAVFASTVLTQAQIRDNPDRFVGCFDNTMDRLDVWTKLTEAMARG